MVNKKTILILFFSIFSGLAWSDKVTDIEIEKVGIAYQGRSKVEQEGCKLFRPTKEQIANYFNQASRMEEGGSTGHQYYSPCIATGKVTFKDGKSGEFTLQSSGFGSGTFGNKEVIYFFHKDNQWVDPFQCTYAMGDEPEPGCEP
ncbi:hypothetical protein ACGVWS_04590 [Enterobacteriaceae bacterium LUAb1]